MVDVKRLQDAVEWSVRQLQAPRQARVDAVRQFVGSHYSDHGAEKRVPVNQIELAVTIYLRHLAARAPRVMVSSRVDELKPFARSMELALNQVPEEIGLASTFRRVVLEALFGIGVAKVGIAAGGDSSLGHDSGRTFVDLVNPDDYFLDMAAKSRETIQYEGNDYWLDVETARDMGWEGLEPDEHTTHGEGGAQRAEGVGKDTGAPLLYEQVHLRDVWVVAENRLITYAVKTKQVLRNLPWDGPEGGPYYTLSFSDVPGNLMPLPPVAMWRDLHELSNDLFRKLAKQAMAKKTVAAFPGGNEDSVNALKLTSDGEGLKYSGAKPEQITLGGIDAPTLAFFLQCKDLSSYMAGNLDSLGGLGPVSDTATQDEAIGQAAGARMASMKASVTEWARRVWKALAWYEWTDPLRRRVIAKPVDGTDMVVVREWSAETREGDFLDFNLEIDPYSMEDDTPASRLQKVRAVIMELVLPAMPLIQQQGGSLDFRALMDLVARLGNVDELRGLVRFGEPIEGERAAGGSGSPSFKPAKTERTYTRRNVPGASRSGKDDVMGRILMGGGVQGSEAASLSRGTA